MAIPITVPRLGWSMEEGTFVEWLKRDGDPVKPGDAVFVLESDKAAENIEAIDAGMLRIPPDSPQPGDKVKVGEVLAYLVAEGEQAPARVKEATAAATVSAAPAPPVQRVSRETEGRRHNISPRARRVARELGIDASTLQGSGRNGRIRERDVRAATAEGRLIPHTPIRKTIAARMVAGVTEAAPVTLTTKADATNLVRARKQFAGSETIPSYTDFLLKITASALRQHPQLMAQWRDGGLFLPTRVHVAFAVDTDAGLLAPVVRDVDQLSLGDIAISARDLIARARAGKLTAEVMRGAVFTITNLGMFGVDAFTPILHLPQCAILGVGRIVREPAVVGDRIEPRAMMTLSLTFDHRVVDGAPAARFLDAIRQAIEQLEPEAAP